MDLHHQLDNVQVGDRLVFVPGTLGHNDDVVVVERVTKTQIITNRGKYMKKSGRSVGADRWSASYIHIPKEGELEQIASKKEHKHLVRFCSHFDWDALTTEKLKEIKNLIE